MSKKMRPVNFDVMVKFLIQRYDIPTKKDINNLVQRIDRLETLISNLAGLGKHRRLAGTRKLKPKSARGRGGRTSTDMVMAVIKKHAEGVGVAEIQVETGFGQKKIRNIIYRLGKTGSIKRISRGTYIVA